jgi:hypothetical protein
MASSTVSSRWMLLAAGATLVAIACGDDDKGKGSVTPPPTTPPTDASTSPATGNNNAPAPGIVGKGCVTDTDCGGVAKCSQTQGTGTLSTVTAMLGIPTDSPAPGGYCTTSCERDADCGQGSVCLGAAFGLLQGECRKGCMSNADCRAPDYECAIPDPLPARDGGVAAPTTGGLALAAQCQAVPKTDQLSDNQTGVACSNRADAGVSPCGDGFCAGAACSGICTTDSHCGAGGACVDVGLPGSMGTCQETCTVDTDCARYVQNGTVGCNQAGARKLCGAKQFPLAPGLVGKTCATTAECGAGRCEQSLGLPPVPAPAGYCTIIGCTDSAQCGGGTCVGTLLAACYANCKADTDCRAGYQCQDRATGGMTSTTAKVCAPIPPVRDGGVAGPTNDAATPPATASDAGVAATVDAG